MKKWKIISFVLVLVIMGALVSAYYVRQQITEIKEAHPPLYQQQEWRDVPSMAPQPQANTQEQPDGVGGASVMPVGSVPTK